MDSNYSFEKASTQEWSALTHTHWQHTPAYADFQRTLGREVHQILIRDQKSHEILGYMLIVHYKLTRSLTLADIPYGPVWLREADNRLLEALGHYLHSYNREHQLITTRLELPHSHPLFKKALFSSETSFAQAQGEVVLNLAPPLDTLLAECSRSTRRNIKKSQKNNLRCEFVYGQDIIDYRDDFVRINKETTDSHSTTTHSDTHFAQLFESLARDTNSFVAVVRDSEHSICAINIITVFGSRSYCPYGASTRAGKKQGAYYFIKCEIIQHLKSQNISDFNWGGVSISSEDKALSGLNQFKLGFGGSIIEHPPRYDLPGGVLYYLYILRALIKHSLR